MVPGTFNCNHKLWRHEFLDLLVRHIEIVADIDESGRKVMIVVCLVLI